MSTRRRAFALLVLVVGLAVLPACAARGGHTTATRIPSPSMADPSPVSETTTEPPYYTRFDP